MLFIIKLILTKFALTNCRKCLAVNPKISYTKLSDKMAYANSADPNQTTPSGAAWSGSTIFGVPLSILRNNCIKSKINP